MDTTLNHQTIEKKESESSSPMEENNKEYKMKYEIFAKKQT